MEICIRKSLKVFVCATAKIISHEIRTFFLNIRIMEKSVWFEINQELAN